jgi:hypothetical protein
MLNVTTTNKKKIVYETAVQTLLFGHDIYSLNVRPSYLVSHKLSVVKKHRKHETCSPWRATHGNIIDFYVLIYVVYGERIVTMKGIDLERF